MKIIDIKYDPSYPVFGLVGDPEEQLQHTNQQSGLDLYVDVINFATGESCRKKLYENSKGLFFRHSGYSPMYLKDFTSHGSIIPFQVIL